jgi:hypothetical protein
VPDDDRRTGRHHSEDGAGAEERYPQVAGPRSGSGATPGSSATPGSGPSGGFGATGGFGASRSRRAAESSSASIPTPPRQTRSDLGFGPPPRTGRRSARRAGAAVPAALLHDRPRREWVVPAAVILAGVLVVVAVGFVVSRAAGGGNGPERAAEPVAGQTTAPEVVLPAQPTDQFPIPLESDSLSPTSASPSVSTSAPSAPPPSSTAPPKRAVFAGSVTIARVAAPGTIDLPSEGSRDWVHWGLGSTFSLERKASGGFAILEGPPTAPRFRHGLSAQKFSWLDGNPILTSDGTPTGVRTCGKGNGFTLSAPASTSSRTLRIYAGALAGRGKLTAKLSTGGPAAVSTFTQQGTKLATTAFTVTYKAPKAGRLQLSWVTDESFDDDCGGVSLEAATLR